MHLLREDVSVPYARALLPMRLAQSDWGSRRRAGVESRRQSTRVRDVLQLRTPLLSRLRRRAHGDLSLVYGVTLSRVLGG